jgi:hypothetical protein
MITESRVGGGPGLKWVLLLLGPVGWVVLLFLLVRGGDERLRGEIPMSDTASQAVLARLRMRNLSVIVAVVLFVLTWLVDGRVGGTGAATILLTAVAIVLAMAFHVAADLAGVDMELDGSRRWVTLRRVHPDFVAAVVERRDDHSVKG